MQPSEPRKTFRFGSYLHQSQVLCSTFIPGAPHLGCSKPFYPLCMVDRLSPNSTGQFLGLFPPSLTPSAPNLSDLKNLPQIPQQDSKWPPCPHPGGHPHTRQCLDDAGMAAPAAARCRVVSWQQGDGIGADGLWLQAGTGSCGAAMQHPKRSIFPSPIFRREMGWDGMGWDGMGWDGMGWISFPHCISP